MQLFDREDGKYWQVDGQCVRFVSRLCAKHLALSDFWQTVKMLAYAGF